MTSVRALRKEELDDWFENEVTQQFFKHLRQDLDSVMMARVTGTLWDRTNPFVTQTNLSINAGMEFALQKMGDPATVRESLEGGLEESDE